MFSMLQKHTIANAIGPIAGQLKNTNVTFLGQCAGFRPNWPIGENFVKGQLPNFFLYGEITIIYFR